MRDNIPSIVDELGDLQAALRPLADRVKELKATLIAHGPDLYSGDRYSARVANGDCMRINTKRLNLLLDEGQIGLVSQQVPRTTVTLYASLAA